MADMPPTDAPDPLAALKDEICKRVGFSVGATIATLLREHAPCACVACQYHSVAYLCDWIAEGVDVRVSGPALMSLIESLQTLKARLDEIHAFGTALDQAGIGPDVEFGRA